MYSIRQYNVRDWSRPVSYHSYNPRVTKPYILNQTDPETEETRVLLARFNIKLGPLDHLARNIRFEDIEIGKRRFDHNSPGHTAEWYIHQWKKTNDLSDEHPTGTHQVYHSFKEFLKGLESVVVERQKRSI